MRRRTRRQAFFGAVGACGALLLALLAGCGSIDNSAGSFAAARPGVLAVATSAVPSPGFWEGTAAHPTGGFEYELARELAKRFGLAKVEVRIVHFHRIVRDKLGGADMAIDLITPTAARERHLSFSTAYLKTAPTVLVRPGTDVADLKTAQEMRWGAIRATTFVEDIETNIAPEAPPRLFDGQQGVLAALREGKIDATLLDMPLAVTVANQSEGELEAAAKLPEEEPLAVALPAGSPNRQAVDSAIRAFQTDGTIERLLKEWVGPQAAEDEQIPLLHTTLH